MSIPELKIAEQLFSKKRLETGAARRETTILQGTALSDSEDGYVAVDYPGNVTVGETTEIRIPTGPAVKAGDSVEISLTGGTGKSPMVSNVPGWGDRQQQQINRSLTAYTDDSAYYLLSSTVPVTPTDDTWEDAGWSTSEPIIGQEETRTLYVSRRVELVDGTVTWSEPAKVVTSASLDVMRNAILSTVSETYTTKTEFAESSDTASGSGRTVATEDAAGLELIDLAVYGESVQDGTPSPDAPVEIRTVSGVNLADPSAFQNGYMPSTVAGTVNPGLAAPSATRKEQTTAYIPVIAGESYTFYTANSSGEQGWLAYRFFDSAYTTIANRPAKTYDGESASYESIVAPSNAAYVRMSARMYDDGVMMVSRNAPVYTPYGSIGLEVHSKNLLNKPYAVSLPYTHRGVTYSDNGDGGIAVAGTATGGDSFVSLMQYNSANNSLNVGETYTLSTHSETVKARVYSAGSGTTTDASVTYTVASESWQFLLCVQNGSSANTVVYPQVEKGTTATDYEPYRETVTPISLQGNTLASLPDGTKDVLHVEQGRAWIEKNVSEIILDGSETFNRWGSSPTMYTNSHASALRNILNPSSISDRFQFVGTKGNNNMYHDGEYQFNGTTNTPETSYTNGNISFRSAETGTDKTVASWKEWVAANPIRILYELGATELIDLGEVSLPTVQDGDTVRIIAEVQPVFDTSWWRDTAIVNGMEHAQNTADAASSGVTDLREYTDSRLEQTSRDITATFTKSIELVGETTSDITERVSTIENTVRINANGVTIAASDSPISANLNNAGLVFSADNEAVLTLNAQTSTAEAERVSIGNYQWREMGDNAIALVWIGE